MSPCCNMIFMHILKLVLHEVPCPLIPGQDPEFEIKCFVFFLHTIKL